MPFSDDQSQLEHLISTAMGSALEDARRSVADEIRRSTAGMRQRARENTFRQLRDALRRLDGAGGQADLLRALLEEAGRFAGRTALLLAGPQAAQGWGLFGWDAEARAEDVQLAWEDAPGWREFAAGRGSVALDAADCALLCRQLGAEPPSEGVLVPLVLQDEVAAALYADRSEPDGELQLHALQVLAFVAAQAVELQGLRERDATPTLYVTSERDGATGLGLWQAGAAAPPPPEPVAIPRVESPAEEAVSLEEEAVAPEGEAEAAPEADVAADEELEAVEASEGGWEMDEEPAGAEPAGETLFASAGTQFPEPPAAEPFAPPFDDLGPTRASSQEGSAAFEVEEEGEAFVGAADELSAPAAGEDLWQSAEAEEETATDVEAYDAFVEGEPEAVAPVGEEPVGEPEDLYAEAEPWQGGGGAEALPEAAAEALPEPPAAATFAAEEADRSTARLSEPSLPAVELGSEATVRISPEAIAQSAAAPAERVEPLAAPPAAAEPEDETQSGRTAPFATTTPAAAPRPFAGGSTEVKPPPDLEGPGWAFRGDAVAGSAGAAERDEETSAIHDEARRLARLLVSEIKLYNEEQVEEGRRHRDIYSRLQEDIDRSRQMYRERVDPRVLDEVDYFEQEMVSILAGGDADALGT